MNKYVLITNIDHVVIGDVRTSTHALLLEEWLGSLDGKSLRPSRVVATELARMKVPS